MGLWINRVGSDTDADRKIIGGEGGGQEGEGSRGKSQEAGPSGGEGGCARSVRQTA
jgi:hypothetical protein